MKTGFVTETHLLAYCTACGQPWQCGEKDCQRQACCLGVLDDIAAVRRIESSGWRTDGAGVFCPGCAVAIDCERGRHQWVYSDAAGTRMCWVCETFDD
ncbi:MULTISPECIES: hypothetical protein [unclassified Nocardia]|uniref:hypothetical protein n=1 Tax=unclassified Nocardia TaxID=2637762 RepID=UPI001CE4AB46|nr:MULTISPECIES: hypothetical protein [unclassified Nocardia]